MRNNRVKLVTEYANGTTIATKETEVFCGVKSVGRTEYYGAYAAGLTPSYVIDVAPDDYSYAAQGTTMPNKVILDTVTYMIIRTFKKDRLHMELTVG